MNKDPVRTQNAKKVLIKDQVLKIRTLLETVTLRQLFARFMMGSSIYVKLGFEYVCGVVKRIND